MGVERSNGLWPDQAEHSAQTFTLESVYADALKRIESLHVSGRLSKEYYDVLLRTTNPDDLITNVGNSSGLHNGGGRFEKVVDSTMASLNRYADAIDMIAQSSPQASGLNIVGMVWGSLKFLLVIAKDISAAHDTIVQTLDYVRQSLPNLEALIYIYGESQLQLLYKPLLDIYAAIISFGLQTAEHLCRNTSSLKALAHSAWSSLQSDFASSLTKLKVAGQRVEQAANVEHMYATDLTRKDQGREMIKQDRFRREIRRHLRESGVGGIPSPTLQPINDAPMGLLSQHFTGRTEELAQLRTMISCLRSSDQPGRCAIVGMPGLGKTQLALKTASEAFGQSKAVSILWVSAATSQRFIQGYSKILDLVDHIDRDHSDQSVKLASAQRWLECDNNSRSKLNKGDFPTTTTTDAELSWLLICDNVNDDTVPLLRENLPRCNKRGVIMITTRNMDVAKAFTYPGEQRQQIMSLDLPKREEAVELLCKELESLHSYKLHSKPAMDIDKAEELVLSLGRLPFAISQAASFANQSSKDLDYILRLCQGERKLQMLSWDNRFAIYEQRSIVAMFGTRLEDLNREEPLTSMLLKALALMDPESIPTDIWATGYSLAEPSNLDPRWVMRDFYDHKDTIGQNETETDGAETQQRFDHPKVTSSEGSSTGRYMVKLRTTLSRRKQSSSSKPQVVCKEVTALDSDLGRQIDHVEASLNRWNQPMWGLLNDPLEFLLAIQRLQKLALLHTVDHGKAVRMHDLVQLMVRQDMKRIGAENFCLNIAASTIQQSLFLSGNPEKPSSWLGYERLLPHLQSLIAFHQSMDCCSYRMVWAVRMMAKYLRFRGEPVECVEMLLKIVPQEEHHHGPNDQDLMRNLMELVLTYNHQGEWDSAEPLIRRVAICRKDLLGERHPLYINTLASMSIIKKAQKQYEEAESLIQEAIRGYRALPGERDRERSLPVQHNLGLLYAAQGRYEEAIQVYEKTLHEVEGLLDPGDHISVTLMANLADAQCKSGHQLQAQLTYERALKIMEEVWGVEHPETLRMMNDLGQVYEMQLRWEDAEALYVKLLEVQKKQWGEEHVKTLNAMGSLAHTYSGQGRYGDSMDLQQHVVKCMVDQFGLEDENTLSARCSLATYRRDVGSMKRRQHLRGDTIVP